MADETDLVTSTVEVIVKPIADLIQKLAGSAAEEIGLTLQDSIKVYRAKRQIKLLEKVADVVNKRGLTPSEVPLKILLPVMDNASVEADEDLHSAWAALLVNAADPITGSGILPCFVEILKQLSGGEAIFLGAVYDHVDGALTSHFSKPKRDGTWPELVSLGGHTSMLQKYADCGLTKKSGSVLNNYPMNQRSPDAVVADDYRQFNTRLGNLIRLGLLSEREERDSQIYFITRIGYEFVKACRFPGSGT
jgi:hypothetical protein